MSVNKKEIIENLLKVIEVEVKTLQDLKNSIQENIIDSIDCLYKTRGNVVVTGIGKSAIIGQKIAATFNSTGTKSVFIHATDAVHGDLGFITNDDVVLCISKSGETEEIKNLIPHLKKKGIVIIGMCSNKDSYINKVCNHFIWIPVEKEADPNNLAPTASTTAQLVMGDAIALCLQSLRGFSAEEFALHHPGGNLGKLLNTTVGELMLKNAKPFVQKNASIQDVIITISSGRLGACVVLDDEKPIGIITDGDLRRMLQKQGYQELITANQIMSISPKTIQYDTLAIHALHMMESSSITQLIVMQNDKLFGIIHLHDIIKAGIQ
jgi:arabinose-5-phosphate isomerase